MSASAYPARELVDAFFAGQVKVQTASDLRFRVIDDEALVLRQEAAEVLGLNPVGTLILQTMIDGASAQELIDQLQSVFEVDREHLIEDVQSFLAELIENGLLGPALEAEP